MELFVIKDVKSKFQTPFVGMNKAVVQRNIMNVLKKKDENDTLTVNPEDYQLFKIGEFDENTGKIVSTDQEFVCNVIDLANIVNAQ